MDSAYNAGTAWNQQEDNKLINSYRVLQLDVTHISREHGRTTGAILSRLKKIGLINDTREARGYNTFMQSSERDLIHNRQNNQKEKIKEQLANEGQAVLNFGKYSGQTYLIVYSFQYMYCQWFISQKDSSYEGLLFRQWIERMNYINMNNRY